MGVITVAQDSSPALGFGSSSRFLVEQGIDSISLNPDAVLPTRLAIAALERELGG